MYCVETRGFSWEIAAMFFTRERFVNRELFLDLTSCEGVVPEIVPRPAPKTDVVLVGRTYMEKQLPPSVIAVGGFEPPADSMRLLTTRGVPVFVLGRNAPAATTTLVEAVNDYVMSGNLSPLAVNFPPAAQERKTDYRVTVAYDHASCPGVATSVSEILAQDHVQTIQKNLVVDEGWRVGYFMADVDRTPSTDARKAIHALPGVLRFRCPHLLP